MSTYAITRWRSGEIPEPLETQEIDASNAGEACRLLGWKLFKCSFRLISGDIDRWNSGKERIRSACRKAPVIADLLWRSTDNIRDNASGSSDIELIEALALQAEEMTAVLKPGAEGRNNIEQSLTDTSLLIAFATWRLLPSPKHLRTHCQYCHQAGETVRWELPAREAIKSDKRPFAFVCQTNTSCLQRSLEDGYVVISQHRLPYVEVLFKQGKTRQEIQEILHVSKELINKDIRILRARGNLPQKPSPK